MRFRFVFAVTFILVSILTLPALAQDWFLVESGVTSDLYDIQFVDRNTGWAVGADSTIIKTTDGGHTWFRQTGGVAEEYRCVYFRDALNGWVGGAKGVILHTTDGGASWNRQFTPSVMNVNRFFFLNADTGWIAAAHGECGWYGCSGSLLKTTNAGKSWEENLRTPLNLSFDSTALDSVFLGRFHDIVFMNESVGYACGEIYSDRGRNIGCIISTTDAGETWNHIVEWNVWTATYGIGVISQSTIYAATHVGVGRTRNSGATVWESLMPYTSTYDIVAPHPDCVVGLGHYGGEINIREYRDGATEPTYQGLEGKPSNVDLSNIDLFMGLFMFDTTNGWICGNDGILWRKPALVNSVENPERASAAEFRIEAVYPNPARASATIEYFLEVRQNVRLAVYSLLGAEVAVLENGLRGQGSHRVDFSAPAHLPSGLYFYELQTPQGTARGSMLLTK